MSSGFNEQIEVLKALIELKAIRRDGMDLFFKLEDAYGKLAKLKVDLLDGNKHHQLAAHRMTGPISELNELIYELQTIINIGEL